jgi:ABC-type multidrug transport system ATPase subunit
MSGEIIKATEITKIYGKHVILNKVNITVNKGKTIALVGENGSGKTTLLQILAGLINTNTGNIIKKKNIKEAYIPDKYSKTFFTIKEYIKLIKQIEGIQINEENETKLYEDFFLQDMINTPMKYLSKGSLQKVAVIQAIIDKRDIIFLDEPLSGQDYLSQKKFCDYMKKQKKDGLSIVMACHEPFLIHELADEIVQIKDGKLIDGYSYIYNKTFERFLIIAQYQQNENPTFENEIKNELELEIKYQKDNIELMGNKEKGQKILATLIRHNINIIKYEEIGSEC